MEFAAPDTCSPAAQLPAALPLIVLLCLPADARARASAVCRAWRDAVAQPAAWTEVDLTPEGGLTCKSSHNPTPFLEGLADRQLLGHLRVLRVTISLLTLEGVLRLVRDGRVACLRELYVAGGRDWRVQHDDDSERFRKRDDLFHALLTEARGLTLLELDWLDLFGHTVTLLLVPRLRVRAISLLFRLRRLLASDDFSEQLAVALERLDGFEELSVDINEATRPDLFACLMTLVLSRRLKNLTINYLSLASTTVPQLARVVRESTSLRYLTVCGADDALFDADDAADFANALRANASLVNISFCNMRIWDTGNAAAGVALCAALVRHPTLTHLIFCEGHGSEGASIDLAVLDTSLAAILCANSPVLRAVQLRLTICDTPPLEPLLQTFEALAHNTHLTMLAALGLDWSTTFLYDTVLPAVRANTSLYRLKLSCGSNCELSAEAQSALAQAMQLVAERLLRLDAIATGMSRMRLD